MHHIHVHRGLATRKLSIRLSVKRVDCDKTEESSAQIFLPYKKHLSDFYENKSGWWDPTPSTWNLWVKHPIGAK